MKSRMDGKCAVMVGLLARTHKFEAVGLNILEHTFEVSHVTF